MNVKESNGNSAALIKQDRLKESYLFWRTSRREPEAIDHSIKVLGIFPCFHQPSRSYSQRINRREFCLNSSVEELQVDVQRRIFCLSVGEHQVLWEHTKKTTNKNDWVCAIVCWWKEFPFTIVTKSSDWIEIRRHRPTVSDEKSFFSQHCCKKPICRPFVMNHSTVDHEMFTRICKEESLRAERSQWRRQFRSAKKSEMIHETGNQERNLSPKWLCNRANETTQ